MRTENKKRVLTCRRSEQRTKIIIMIISNAVSPSKSCICSRVASNCGAEAKQQFFATFTGILRFDVHLPKKEHSRAPLKQPS